MKKFLLTILSIVFFTSACSTQRLSLRQGAKLDKPSFEKSQPFFIMGFVGQPAEIDAQTVCKGKTPTAVETHITFVDGLLGSITFGLYTPMTVRVYCE